MIAATNIAMRFGKDILFENVDIKFKAGCRYGLIGANGSGKSTFMRILTGQLSATTGDVAIERDRTMGYLKQDHYQYDGDSIIDIVYMGNSSLWKLHVEREDLYSRAELTEAESVRVGDVEDLFAQQGGYTMESDAAKLLVGLGIPEKLHSENLDTLTGGFKLRVLLAQVLFGNPDVLLMDEPTNHLDMASRDWLVGLLQRHEGTVVVISHDRHFLNQSCTHIADLDYREIRHFTGNYDDFMTANAIALERKRKENTKMEKRMTELKGFINRFSANASKARQATSRQKELDKIQLNEIRPSSRVSPFIRFNPEVRLGDKIIECSGIGKSYDSSLFSEFSCTIGNNEKVAIIGTNGVGKTTLLKILIGKMTPDSGQVIHGETVKFSYFPQDSNELLTTDETAMEWLSRFAPPEGLSETELRAVMGKMLFRGDDAMKPINVLSGGERARLIIGMMTLERGNLLVLDEPTNHLDLESIEALNYALSLIDETVLFVSHDREFINSLATRVIEIGDGTVIDYAGSLDEYESWKPKNSVK